MSMQYCLKCEVEFVNLDGSNREKCWSCIKGFKGKSKVIIKREGDKK